MPVVRMFDRDAPARYCIARALSVKHTRMAYNTACYVLHTIVTDWPALDTGRTREAGQGIDG